MSREIILSSGAIALVDDEDFDRLSGIKWCQTDQGYAQNGKHGRMHRMVLGLGKGVSRLTRNSAVVNHRNHNKLDNRKENLEVVTLMANSAYSKNKQRKKMGRPTVEEPRRARSFRATDAEWEMLNRGAQASGIGDVSAWLRFIGLREARQLGVK